MCPLVPRLSFLATFFAFAFSFLPGLSRSQVTWERLYGGPLDDYGSFVRQTRDGGYIVVGTTWGAKTDFYLFKTDAFGDTLWSKALGGDSSDYGRSVQQTSDAGYIVAGWTESFGAGGFDAYLVKTDSSGNVLWTKTYGDTSNDWAWAVQQTQDGGYVVAGGSLRSSPVFADVYLVKTDAQGDTLWTRSYGGIGDTSEVGYSVLQTQDGGYLIAGYRDSDPFLGRIDVYLIRTNANGDILWTKTYGGMRDTLEAAYGVHQTSDSGFIIVGYQSVRRARVYLIKTNAQGDTLWTRTYKPVYSDSGASGQSVYPTQDGGYIITGGTGFQQIQDLYLLKVNAQGDSLWSKTYGGPGVDGGLSVQQTADGGFIVAGDHQLYFTGPYDVYLIKTDSFGNVGVEEFPKSVGAQHFAFSVRPSPVREGCAISFALPVSGKASLVVFDALGRRVRVLLDGKVAAGPQSLRWDGRDAKGDPLPSGVYFLRLEAGKVNLTRKVVIIH